MTDVTLFGESPFDAIRREDGRGEYWTGRDLAAAMGYHKWENFAATIGKAKDSLSLVQGVDTAAHHFLVAGSDGGRWGNQRLDDYRLTRFAAYLVAMAGDGGKEPVAEARIYFAVRTREAEVAKPSLPSRRELAQMVIDAEDRAEAAERRNAELEPKAAAVDLYMDASEVFLLREVAKMLGVKESPLRQHCYDRRILMSHPARRNEPYAQHVTAGYFEVKSRPVEVRGEPRAFNTTYVTTQGVEFLRRSLTRAGLIGDGPRLTVVRADRA